jgi:protein involved in polysaccharide export with SLBB domain
MVRSCTRLLAMLLSLVLVAGTPAFAQAVAAANSDAAAYRLGAGDKVRVTVYNEDTLSGEYEVDGSGNLSLQLIGAISAAGKSVPEVISAIQDKLKDGYMKNPSVAVEVLNYRPFYVLGEVKEPGKYPYVSGMTVLNAIALAGGHTYRGKKGRAFVIRADDPARKEVRLEDNALIMPGDIVRVPERVF